MRTCPVCGLDVEDSYLFCPEDGASLVETPAAPTPVAADLPADAQATTTAARIAPGVVLYCGECAAEYPMTFVECPVHHAALMTYKIQPIPPAPAILPTSEASVDQPNHGEPHDYVDSTPVPSNNFPEDYTGRETVHESRIDNPGFRIVAATLVVALALFFVGAVYIFFSGGARRQTVARATEPVSPTLDPEPQPFIQTPAEALDYREESAVVPTSPTTLNDTHSDQAKKALAGNTASLAPAPKAAATVSPTPGSKDRVFNAPSEPEMTRPAIARESTSARVEQGRVGARLIRVRSMRTASGVRYFLTFDLQDESGRHAQWERLQVSTRAASGVSHSQAIPFVHRLGASGALTFTVSVEMRGHSESDWQGRVVCTTTGSDNDGKPLRASFGTNVTP